MKIGCQEQDERDWIDAHFAGRCGRFLDLGAFDGVTNSLTAGLVDAGWSGVMVEADPTTFGKLVANQGGNPRLTLVHSAIVPKSAGRLSTFWECCQDHQLSTCSNQHRDNSIRWARTWDKPLDLTFREYRVAAMPIAALLAELRTGLSIDQFDFMSIDIEGLSLQVFAEFLTCSPVWPEVFCVDRKAHEVMPLLGDKYEMVWDANKVNVIARRRSS